MTSQGSRDGGCFHPDTNLGYSPRMEPTFRFARDLVVLNVGNGGILDENPGEFVFFCSHPFPTFSTSKQLTPGV